MTGSALEADATTVDGSLSPAPIFQTFFGYLATAALGSGVELGVFDALADGARDAAAVAAAIGADERGTGILLEALAALGFLEPRPDGYRLTPVSDAFLVRDRPAYLGGLADIFYSDWQWQGFLGLADAVRAGGTTLTGQDLEQPLHPFWETYVRSWGAAGAGAAAALAKLLAPWIAARRPFASLDLACGDGLYSFTLAEAHPHAQISLLDQPHVLATTRRSAEQRGLLARARFLEGDMFEVALEGPYDLIIASNLFHLFGQEQCRRLLNRVQAALKPDGRLAIHEFAPSATSPTEDPVPRLFSLIMLVRTHGGQTHTLTDYERMLAETGFTPPQVHPLPGQPTCLLLSEHAR